MLLFMFMFTYSGLRMLAALGGSRDLSGDLLTWSNVSKLLRFCLGVVASYRRLSAGNTCSMGWRLPWNAE